ncbi:MAG: ECF transporter S component [Defluviitaleaceae bacterium]|nr:ECF transporter S component [Defluviitaleaceae bacterium]
MSGKVINNRSRILWITRTAIFIALLIVMQAATAPLGNTLITGSLVNMMLVISVMLGGLWSGAAVSLLSPVLARFFGIGPFWVIVPFIMLGNLALVLVWHFIGNQDFGRRLAYIAALVLGAAAKFLVLHVGVAEIAVPIILELPEPQATVISTIFSVPQLVTALIGGGIALIVLPILKKAVMER